MNDATLNTDPKTMHSFAEFYRFYLAEHSNANNHCKDADSGESAHNTRLYGTDGQRGQPAPDSFQNWSFAPQSVIALGGL